MEFDVSLGRALRRYEASTTPSKGVREAYERRYIPGQKLHLDDIKPRELADVVVVNNDLDRPILRIKGPS